MRLCILLIICFGLGCSNHDSDSQPEHIVWQTPIPMESYNSTPPIIYRDLVIFQLVDSLWAVDRESGLVQWRLKLQDGRAVTYTVPQYDCYALYCGKLEIYKVNLDSGTIEWVFPTESTADVRHLATDGQDLHFGTGHGAYYRVNLETGALAGYFMIEGENVISAMPNGDKVFLCSYDYRDFTGHLTCLRNGQFLWRIETGGIMSKPAFYGSWVFVSEHPSSVVAYDRETGGEIHRYVGYSHPQLSPIVENNQLYIGSPETLTKIDLASQSVLWTVDHGLRYDLVTDVDQFLVRYASRLRGYSKATGGMNFEFFPEDEVVSAPCVHEGVIYFIGGSNVYAYMP